MTQDDHSETEGEVRALLKRRDESGAILVLQSARAAARMRQDRQAAGDFSGWMASIFLGMGQADDALREFEEAERDEPANPYHKLVTAAQLLALRDDAATALRKLRDAAPNLPSNASVLHGYYDLLGQVYLRLSRQDEAIDAFRAMAGDDLVRGVMVESLCLALTSRLIAEGLVLTECERYLDAVDQKASRSNAVDVQAQVVRLRAAMYHRR